MSRFSDILLASDFDRTLTNMQDAVVQANIEAIKYFMSEGGVFTVVTGRSHFMFRDKAKLIPVNAPLIMANGAISFDYKTETALFMHEMPASSRRVAQDVMAAFPEARIELQCLDGHYVFGEDPVRDEFMARAHAVPKRVPLEAVPDPVLKIAIIGSVVRREGGKIDLFADCSDEENLYYESIMRFVAGQPYGGEYEVMRTAPRIVELQKKGVSKGVSARELAGKIGRHTLVCAGDAPNDLSMLLEADIAFVPASAVPEILSGGFNIGAHCNDGTIASVVEYLDSRA